MILEDSYLPHSVTRAINLEPDLGVCVLFRNDKLNEWFYERLNSTDYSIEKLERIIYRGKYSDFEKDFAIINKDGEVCFSTCDIKVQKDDSEYIHINDNEFILKIIENAGMPFYVGGKTYEELVKVVKKLIENNIIRKPKDFGKNGFKNTPTFNGQEWDGN